MLKIHKIHNIVKMMKMLKRVKMLKMDKMLKMLQAICCRLQQAAGCSRLQAASRQATGCILLHAELLQLSHDRAAAWGMQLRPHSNTETGRPMMTHQ